MRRVSLVAELARVRPELEDAEEAVAAGRVVVEGRVLTNPRSMVTPGCSIVVTEPIQLRGSLKLRAALDHFRVAVADRVCLDVGAAAGGFTTVLLERGAKRVYAVDAGHGQLLGSLRQDPRVVNLEATNVGDLTTTLVHDEIDLVVIDVSYLSLTAATVQLNRLVYSPGAGLVGLVKPMFELGLGSAPTDRPSLDAAIGAVVSGVAGSGWQVVGRMESPRLGAKGALEGFVRCARTD